MAFPVAAGGNALVWLIGYYIYRRRRHGKDGWGAILLGLLRITGFVILFIATSAAFVWMGLRVRHWLFLNGYSKKTVTRQTIWHGAPVLIISPAKQQGRYQAAIVYYEHIGDYVREHPGSTFLVPRGQEAKLNKQLRAVRDVDSCWPTGRFEVIRQTGSGQYLRVYGGHPEDLQVSYYEASLDGIEPRYWDNNWRGRVPGIEFLLNIALWVIVGGWRKKRRAAGRLAQDPARLPTE